MLAREQYIKSFAAKNAAACSPPVIFSAVGPQLVVRPKRAAIAHGLQGGRSITSVETIIEN